MATLTTPKTSAGAQAKMVHAGVQSATAFVSISFSMSAGDVIQMVKVPNGAVITDVVLIMLGTAQNTVTASIGDGDSTARFLAATSMSNNGVVRATVGLPYSYSQDDTVDVKITAVTSATVDGSIAITVTYKMDDPLR